MLQFWTQNIGHRKNVVGDFRRYIFQLLKNLSPFLLRQQISFACPQLYTHQVYTSALTQLPTPEAKGFQLSQLLPPV